MEEDRGSVQDNDQTGVTRHSRGAGCGALQGLMQRGCCDAERCGRGAVIALMGTEKVQESKRGTGTVIPAAGLGQLPAEPLPGQAIPGVLGASPGPDPEHPAAAVPATSVGQSRRCSGLREGRTARPGVENWGSTPAVKEPSSKGQQIPVCQRGTERSGRKAREKEPREVG